MCIRASGGDSRGSWRAGARKSARRTRRRFATPTSGSGRRSERSDRRSTACRTSASATTSPAAIRYGSPRGSTNAYAETVRPSPSSRAIRARVRSSRSTTASSSCASRTEPETSPARSTREGRIHERGAGEKSRTERVDLPPGERADREPQPRLRCGAGRAERHLRVRRRRLHRSPRDLLLRVREGPLRPAPLHHRPRPRGTRVRVDRGAHEGLRRRAEAGGRTGRAGEGDGPAVLTNCASVGVAHWDEVEWLQSAKGEMDASVQRLGDAAGTRGVGVNRVRVEPGRLPTPPHSHGASEELYFVLGGSGLAWQDGEVHEIRPRDCVIHRANEMEHTFVAGPEGLEYLVFGTRHPTELGWLPRSRAIRLGWPWVEGRDGDPSPRPANIVTVDEVELESERNQTWAYLTPDGATTLAGLGWEKLAAGRRGSVPHCHSAEAEVFVVLEGEATLELWPREGGVEETPLRAGHLVARPAGTRVGHSFRAGPGGATMLVYGTRDPNDMCWYPRSGKIFWRGLGVIGRIETLDYFDGEPIEED